MREKCGQRFPLHKIEIMSISAHSTKAEKRCKLSLSLLFIIFAISRIVYVFGTLSRAFMERYALLLDSTQHRRSESELSVYRRRCQSSKMCRLVAINKCSFRRNPDNEEQVVSMRFRGLEKETRNASSTPGYIPHCRTRNIFQKIGSDNRLRSRLLCAVPFHFSRVAVKFKRHFPLLKRDK